MESRLNRIDLYVHSTDCGLLISSGSDFHGANKPDIEMGTGRGSMYVPYECLYNLRGSIEKK